MLNFTREEFAAHRARAAAAEIAANGICVLRMIPMDSRVRP